MDLPSGPLIEAPRWDLSTFFASLDDPGLASATEAVVADVDRLRTLFDHHDVRGGAHRPLTDDDAAVVEAVLDALNRLLARTRLVGAYLYGRVATDAADERAAARHSRFQTETAPLAALTARFEAWVARLGPEAVAGTGPVADDHAFPLRRAARAAGHQMSEAEEDLAAELRPTGSAAWARLHRDVTATLTATVDRPDGGVEVLPISVVRGLAGHPDPARRRAAHRAELAAWATVGVPLAAALNGAKGEAVVVDRRRGWTDPLDAALFANQVEREALEAMQDAVLAALPAFRTYLQAKHRLLERDRAEVTAGAPATDGIPWWDLLAPLGAGASGVAVDWRSATERVAGAFRRFSGPLAALVERADAERWIDAEPRAGKVGGAFCMPVREGESRILCNFDGSASSVQTLAHELGHAYHNLQLQQRTPLQRRTPMALAETASIFCETIVVEAGLATATTDEARLAILDTDLQGATQVVVDIHSRFLFERDLYRRRTGSTLGVEELCELMADAQDAAYAEGLDPEHRHPWMWAVKGHYFTPFYNWPYTFGLLFGLGLHQRFEAAPDEFRAGYDDLLSATGLDTAAGLAQRFGIDLADPTFWSAGLDVLRRRIDRFVAVAATHRTPTTSS